MPDHLKNAPNTKEFQKYLESFVKKHERQHRKKLLKEIVNTAFLMIAS